MKAAAIRNRIPDVIATDSIFAVAGEVESSRTSERWVELIVGSVHLGNRAWLQPLVTLPPSAPQIEITSLIFSRERTIRSEEQVKGTRLEGGIQVAPRSTEVHGPRSLPHLSLPEDMDDP